MTLGGSTWPPSCWDGGSQEVPGLLTTRARRDSAAFHPGKRSVTRHGEGPWSLGSRQPWRFMILIANRRGNDSLERGPSHMGLDSRLGSEHFTPRLWGAPRRQMWCSQRCWRGEGLSGAQLPGSSVTDAESIWLLPKITPPQAPHRQAQAFLAQSSQVTLRPAHFSFRLWGSC